MHYLAPRQPDRSAGVGRGIGTPSRRTSSQSVRFVRSSFVHHFPMFKAYPTPINKPLWPIFTGGVLTFLFFGKVAAAMGETEEFRNDPRNPNAGKKH